MTALILDDHQRKVISAYIKNSHDNPITTAQLFEIRDGKCPPPGDNHSITIPMGYRVVYTEELHDVGHFKGCRVKHISVSVATEGKFPNFHAMDLILQLFEFEARTETFLSAVESDSAYVYQDKNSISVVERVANDESSADELDFEKRIRQAREGI